MKREDRTVIITIIMIFQSEEQYNYLTSVEFHHRDEKNCYWKFKCICGKEYIARTSDVKKGAIKSCGCMRGKILSEPIWAKPKGVAARNALIHTYKRNAIKRNLDYDLTVEQFEILAKGDCFYCGIKPFQEVSNRNNQRNGSYIYNGLDRVDNSKGYTFENCVSCCGICNRAKNNLTAEQFFSWLERIIKHGKEHSAHDRFVQGHALPPISRKN